MRIIAMSVFALALLANSATAQTFKAAPEKSPAPAVRPKPKAAPKPAAAAATKPAGKPAATAVAPAAAPAAASAATPAPAPVAKVAPVPAATPVPVPSATPAPEPASAPAPAPTAKSADAAPAPSHPAEKPADKPMASVAVSTAPAAPASKVEPPKAAAPTAEPPKAATPVAATPVAATPVAATPVAAKPAAAPAPAPAVPSLAFSGLIFGSLNVQKSTTSAKLSGQTDNSFILDRAYLNFRIAAGDRGSVRITTDVYQTSEAAANAYTLRVKYAYFQYDVPKFRNGASMVGRIGVLHNVTIDHIETFWSRYISQTAIERAGYFSSADAGIASVVTLPNKRGEVYASITNGAGYASRENNRFKDFSARLSLTPLANGQARKIFRTLTLSAWTYRGATSSAFVNGGTGQIGPIGEALDRSRSGIFVGLRDPRLVLGAEFAQRHEAGEQGANTTAKPRTRTELTGTLRSFMAVVRPFAFRRASGQSPFGIVARHDFVMPTHDAKGYVSPVAASADNAYHTAIGGVFYDLNQKVQLALDYQESLASSNGVSVAPPAPSKTYFLHFQVNF